MARREYVCTQRGLPSVWAVKERLAALTAGVYKSVGWEKNIKGKLGPRMISLAQSMDPARCVLHGDRCLSLARCRIRQGLLHPLGWPSQRWT